MKPKIQTFENIETAQGYDIHEVMEFVGKKIGMNCYDIYGSMEHFSKWCDQKGYGEKDPEGECRSSSNIWFAEYKKDPNGEATRPEYATVIDWFIEKYMPDQTINEFDMNMEDFNAPDVPHYIKEFSDYVFKEFGKEVTLVLNFE